MGFCIEFESVIYICDVQINFIKICIKMVECVEFLNFIGKFYDVFLIYCKGVIYFVKFVDEAFLFVYQCKDFLDRNINEIRMGIGIIIIFNGFQGYVFSKIVVSVVFVEWGL